MQDQTKRRFSRRHGFAALAGLSLGAVAGIIGRGVAAPAPAPLPPAGCGLACGHLVADWSLAAWQALRAEDGYRDPLAASRILAMMHLAMHDAVNAAAPRYATYLPAARTDGADPAVAAAAAAHGVLLALRPGQQAALDIELGKATLEAGRGPGVAQGLALGAEAARAMLASRAQDGANRPMRYGALTHVGAWRHTPGVEALFAPHWSRLRPFALATPDQFRVAAPPSVESTAYARAFAEVKSLGGRASTARSDEQTRIAHFWYEFSDIAWNRVARVVARDRGLDLWDAARLFALLNMALADGYVAGWDSKLHHDFWRPVTAIRLAGEDFNAATAPDPHWEPLLPTPPIQDHPSTHATLGAAAASVMAGLLGEATPFGLTSTTALPENPVRHFAGFAEAARENAESRVMAGLHFRFACDAGMELGGRIGRLVLANHLQPLE